MSAMHDCREPAPRAVTIAIVGGGFSGTVTAIHLLRGMAGGRAVRANEDIPRIIFIERSSRIARGLAYGTEYGEHLLNAPAGSMSALDDEPGHFVAYCQRYDPAIDRGSFVPRRLYGDYLECLLQEAAALAMAAGRVSFEPIQGEVIHLATHPDGTTLTFGDGRRIHAHRTILALGHSAPAPVRMRNGLPPPPGTVIPSPWKPGVLHALDPALPILLLGTGHTAMDTAVALHAAVAGRRIYAVSRRGLLPLPHRLPGGAQRNANPAMQTVSTPGHETLCAAMLAAPPTIRAYAKTLRQTLRMLGAEGVDWREALAGLRAETPALWQRLPAAERARFLRHARPYWEIHRHRLAPEMHEKLGRLRASGHLDVVSGRIDAIERAGAALRVSVIPRDGGHSRTLTVGAVINCTRSDGMRGGTGQALLDQLVEDGLAKPDPLRLGIQVAKDYALVQADGTPSGSVRYIGPFLCADYWEASAVPELRVHAQRLARSLLNMFI